MTVKWKVVIATVIIIVIGLAVAYAGTIESKYEGVSSPQEIHVTMARVSSNEYVSSNLSFTNTSIDAYYNSTNFYLVNSSYQYINNESNISKIDIKPVQQNEGMNYYYNLNGTYKVVIFSQHEPDVYISPLNQTYSFGTGNIILIIGLIIMLIGMVALVMVIFFPEPEE